MSFEKYIIHPPIVNGSKHLVRLQIAVRIMGLVIAGGFNTSLSLTKNLIVQRTLTGSIFLNMFKEMFLNNT